MLPLQQPNGNISLLELYLRANNSHFLPRFTTIQCLLWIQQAHNKQQDPAAMNAEDGGMRLMATSFDLQIRYVSAIEEQV